MERRTEKQKGTRMRKESVIKTVQESWERMERELEEEKGRRKQKQAKGEDREGTEGGERRRRQGGKASFTGFVAFSF